jgi:tetratricopeptide (TPR) repeat protein
LETAALGGLGDAEYARGRMLSANARLRSCVDLCRCHGFGRLAVANHAQVAHTMLYLSPQDDALKEALAAAEAAARVGHLRAELNARLAAMFALMVLARFETCRDIASEVESLIQRLGARRFDQARLLHLGHAALAEGRRAEAVELLQRALAAARATTLTFHGPWILGVLALAASDREASRRALAEAEGIIAGGCVGHNQLRFYPAAMQVALELGEHEEAERYAAALEEFTRAEPLPWSDFFIARGRALAAVSWCQRDAALTTELERLREEGERLGLETALTEIRTALKRDAPGCSVRRA